MAQGDIFRKKSIERVTAPEELNDYIKVASPSTWMMLAAIFILLVGVTVWGIFGRLDTRVDAAVVSHGGTAIAAIHEDDIDKIKEGMTVLVNGKELTVVSVNRNTEQITDEYLIHLGSFKDGWICTAELSGELEDGAYSAEIVVERIKPISFVVG